MNWNPVLNIIVRIKRDYFYKFGNHGNGQLETWIERLNNDEYNSMFGCLQINQWKEFVLIRYGLADMQETDMWSDPNSIYRECRSVVIDLVNETLVLTPFRKFFNLNEVPENNVDIVTQELANAKKVEFTNKLDGSMQSARWYNDKVFMAGSMALNPADSWRLADGYRMLESDICKEYVDMIRDFQGWTFIFEYISIRDAHVVVYNLQEEGLYLIGMRNTNNGQQMSYDMVQDIAKVYGVPCVEIENITFDEILEQMKIKKSYEKEGWVMNIDGHMIKLKCDDYVQLHRMVDKISSVNVIIKNVADGTFDDLLSKIPESYRDRVLKIANEVVGYRNRINADISRWYEKAHKDDVKTFMIWVDKHVPSELKGYLRNIWNNKECNVLKRGNGYKKMKDMGLSNNMFADEMEDAG